VARAAASVRPRAGRAGCGRLSPRAGYGRADSATFLDLNFNANRRGPARTTTQAAKALPVPGPVTQALRLPRGRRRPIFLDLNFDANRLVEF
jgi:hypothetical protein